MHIFKCCGCRNDIQADYSLIGENVECPICQTLQVVPDIVLPENTNFNGYIIKQVLDVDLLWTTYLAEDIANHEQTVILKTPSAFFQKNVSDFDSFANLLKDFNKPGITGIPLLLASDLKPKKRYFVFEHANMMHRLSVNIVHGSIKTLTALRIARKVAEILKDIYHDKKIICCNLNPDTVRFRNFDEAVLISNIGFSEHLLKDQKLLDQGFSIWNPRYMAPEFLFDGVADTPQIAFYSLGCLLYFMLTGEHPYGNLDIDDIALDSDKGFFRNADSAIVPAPIMKLCEDLSADNSDDRPDSWESVIEKIDLVIDDLDKNKLVLDFRQKFNIWGSLPREAKYQNISLGVKPGKKAKKLYVHKSKNVFRDPKKVKEKKKLPTDTVAVKAPLQRKPNRINFTWGQHKHKHETAVREFPVRALAAMLVLIPIIGIAIFTIYLAQTRSNKPEQQTENNVPPITDSYPANPQQGGRKSEKELLASSLPKAKPDVSQKKQLSKEDKKEDFASRFTVINRFYEENPDEYDLAIEKFHKLQRDAQHRNMVRIVTLIAEKIASIEDAKSRKVNQMLEKIKSRAEDLKSHGASAKAVQYLLQYQGLFAAETKRDRFSMVRQIQNKEKLKLYKLEPNAKEVDFVYDVVEKIARSILQNRLEESKDELNKALQNPELSSVKPILIPLVRDLNYFKKIDKVVIETYTADLGGTIEISLRNGKKIKAKVDAISAYNLFCRSSSGANKILKYNDLSTEEIIKRIDMLKLKNDLLLKGLVYKQREEYDKAMTVLSGIKYELGYPFMMDLFDIKSLSDLNKILVKYQLHKYDGKDPQPLLLDLSRKKISSKAAEQLANSIKSFRDEEAGMEFQEQHGHVLDALLTFAERFYQGIYSNNKTAAQDLKEKKIITVDHPDNFLTILKNAEPYTTIKLPAGVYTFPQNTRSITLKQWGLKIIGSVGTVIEGNFVVSGKSLMIEQLRINNGSLKIGRGADMVIKNCYFYASPVVIDRASNVFLDNSLFSGVEINNCLDVKINHCILLDSSRNIKNNFPLSIIGTKISILNSIVYGKTYAVFFADEKSMIVDPAIARRLRDYSKPQKYKLRYLAKERSFSNCLLFGEKGLSLSDDGTITKKGSQFKKYCKGKSNIYSPPQFLNPRREVWTLVNGSPGSKTRDKEPIGIIWQKQE